MTIPSITWATSSAASVADSTISMIFFHFINNNALHAGLEDRGQGHVVQVLADVLQPPDCDAAFQQYSDGNTLDSSAGVGIQLTPFSQGSQYLAQDPCPPTIVPSPGTDRRLVGRGLG